MLADQLVADLRPLSLATLLEEAPAMTRVDRKYVVPLAAAQALLDQLGPEWGRLAIDGRRTTHYRSTYVDSAELTTVRAHVQQRRRRWKARSRLYVEDGLCRFEVKTRDGRGQTVKVTEDRPAHAYGRLSAADRAFVSTTLAAHRLDVDHTGLVTTMEIEYDRMTLARLDEPSRMTIDGGLRCHLGHAHVWMDPAHVIIETKGGFRASEADRILLGLGLRPRSFSKYAAATSLIRPEISDNDVRPLVGRVLHAAPFDSAAPEGRTA